MPKKNAAVSSFTAAARHCRNKASCCELKP